MCGKATGLGKVYTPNMTITVKTPWGEENYNWGIDNQWYNARSEKLFTVWRKLSLNKCIFQIDSFYEGGKEFVANTHANLFLAAIHNEKEFAVLTCPANDMIAQYHHRMPVLIDYGMIDQFLFNELDKYNFFIKPVDNNFLKELTHGQIPITKKG